MFGSSIEVIEFLDPSGNTMVSSFPEHGSGDIKMGAQLTVQESQVAFFFRDGKSLDKFAPGRHTLSTANVPILSKIMAIPFGGKSPFRANVYFVSLKSFTNLKWGTPEPILFRDKDFAMVRLRARGIFSIRITDPEVFLNTIVGTSGKQTTSQIESYLRTIIITSFTDLLGELGKSVMDLPAMYEEISIAVGAKVQDAFGKCGLQLTECRVAAITLPENVQKMIDERSGMAALGDMNQYMQYKAAQAVGDMGKGGGGGGIAAQGMGLGMGATFGMMMPGMIQNSMNQPQQQQQQHYPNQQQQQPQQPQQQIPPQQAQGTPCPKCQNAVPPGGKFCMNCGNPMAAPKCVKCAQDLTPGAKFCMNCGTPS